MENTIPDDRQTIIQKLIGTNVFQLLTFVTIVLGMTSTNVQVFGIAFLEKEPSSFQCYYDENYQNTTIVKQPRPKFIDPNFSQGIQKQESSISPSKSLWTLPKHTKNSGAKFNQTQLLFDKIFELSLSHPNHFIKANETISNSSHGYWQKCTKEDIC